MKKKRMEANCFLLTKEEAMKELEKMNFFKVRDKTLGTEYEIIVNSVFGEKGERRYEEKSNEKVHF